MLLMMQGQRLFVTAQKDPVESTPGFDGIYKIGTVVLIKQLNKLPDGITSVMVEAKNKAEILTLYEDGKYFEGDIKEIPQEENLLSENEERGLCKRIKRNHKKI